jgi:predicted Fe-Mo cluster-binding NifX family protein
MKIAVVTDDGKMISQHFGRAVHYLVLTVEDGKITRRELRDKPGHHQFAAGEHGEHHQHHGSDPAAQARHTSMAQPISDCTVLISGGMGGGAYENLRQMHIEPVITDEADVDAAVSAYLAGTLKNLIERLH